MLMRYVAAILLTVLLISSSFVVLFKRVRRAGKGCWHAGIMAALFSIPMYLLADLIIYDTGILYDPTDDGYIGEPLSAWITVCLITQGMCLIPGLIVYGIYRKKKSLSAP